METHHHSKKYKENDGKLLNLENMKLLYGDLLNICM